MKKEDNPKQLVIFIYEEGNCTVTRYVGDISLLIHIHRDALRKAEGRLSFCKCEMSSK